VNSECFSKNPRLKDQKKDGNGHKSKQFTYRRTQVIEEATLHG
jgi:hypothetical protein